MGVYAFPSEASKTCKGKAGKSKAHPHYAGHGLCSLRGGRYVARCTSCEKIVMSCPTSGIPYTVVPEAELPGIAMEILANMS